MTDQRIAFKVFITFFLLSSCLTINEIVGELPNFQSSSSFHHHPSSSNVAFNDLSSFQSGVLGSGSRNLLSMSPYLKQRIEDSSSGIINETCTEIWCDAPTDGGDYHQNNDYGADGDSGWYDDPFGDEMNESTRGFWLEAPPDDILYMPPPPMPPAMQAYLMNMENESMKEFIISEDNGEDGDGVRCNFCKLFADPKLYNDDEIYSAASKDNEAFVSSFYLLIFSIIFLSIFVIFFLIKYKKWKIFPVSESCPILSGTGLLGHHKSSSSSSNHPPSDAHLSPVVNEKSSQSIIMDAPLASLGKKSTISTTGKYWRRMPNNVSGNILCMEDRRGLQSLGGSSTCISDHPYSDAASCTSSPVYAELDPSVAGSCHTPPIIGHGSSFSPYIFSSSTYSEVPDTLRGHHPSSILTDSSTYDNAAYLSAASQPFLAGHNPYTGRSLRRLAAQRSAVLNAAGTGNNLGQVSTPLLAGHPYHYQPNSMHHHHQAQQQPGGGQFHFLTGGRPLKKPRPGHSTPQQTNTGIGGFRIGSNLNSTIGARTPAMNHYVTQNESPMVSGASSTISSANNEIAEEHPIQFSSFLENNPTSHQHHHHHHGQHGHHHRKPAPPSSSSSSQYTEMPLLNASPFASTYRMSETHSNNDLNSAASSSSGSGGSTNSSSATSSASLKRPLPPVPSGVRL